MPLFVGQPNRYEPTRSRTGNGAPSLFRATNGFIRGRGDKTYFEVYGGSLDLGENLSPVAITGTVTFTTASITIVGTGTAFTTELHKGQKLETIAGEVIVVDTITDDTHFTAFLIPLTNGTTVALYRLPVLFEIDKRRGSLLTGNALEFDQGTILAVGSGVLNINGAPLTSSLTAARNPQIGIFDPTTGNYLIQALGFKSVPTGITIAAVAAPAAVNASSVSGNTITTVSAHGLSTGSAFTISSTVSVPAPLNSSTVYYAIVTGASTLQVAATLSDARVGAAITLTNIGSGTITITPQPKAMPAGDRSFRVAKASTKLGTPSYGNPGTKLKTTITAGQDVQFSFPAMDSNSNVNDPHDAWRIYGTLFSGTTAQATANADSGPWYYIRTVSAAELGGTAAATYNLEYLDAEISASARLVTFDNDYPQDAEFVATVAGYPVLVSCQGKATLAKRGGTSPGPSIVPFKVSNIAAAPLVLDSGQRAEVPLSPPEIIIGSYPAAGRLYLLTSNTLQIAAFTADQDFPITTRPFWKAGFKNPYAICFVNGRLYGFTSAGATRSVGDGEEGSEEHAFAADVEEIMKPWDASRVFVVHDPQNECVCFVYSAAYQNAQGYWVTRILPFMLRNESWSPEIILSNSAFDMVVSGVASVNGHFEFLAGGRDGLGGMQIKTYRFDTASPVAVPVPYSLGWQFTNGGSENRPKKVKHPRITGQLTAANIGIHGAASSENISSSVMEAGNSGSKSGAIALVTATGIEYYPSVSLSVKDLMVFALNIVGTWPGSGSKDRVDEISMEYVVKGGRR